MSFSERMKKVIEDCRNRAQNMPESTFDYDMDNYAKTRYSHLPYAERFARSMADALINQKVYIYPEDRIIGRTYQLNRRNVENPCIARRMYISDHLSHPNSAKLYEKYPHIEEYLRYQLIPSYGVGHIAWNWNKLLCMGTEAMKKECADYMNASTDAKSIEFYTGVLIMLEALEIWNDKHVSELEKLGMTDAAALCRKVPRFPAETFREAVQAYYMQHLAVMAENPFGGNSPGRLDYYLWPYLEKDLELGRCTMEEARELMCELFVRMDERIHQADGWVETIVVGGVKPNGETAVNPLSYMMIEVFSELNITHPAVYVRISENSPEDFVKLCGEYMCSGSNRAQILSDDNIIKALAKFGVPYEDAVDYMCGGCMEIGIQGKTSDFLYNGWFNTVKIAELALTGGYCLKNKVKVEGVSFRGLKNHSDFESFYSEFIAETKRLVNVFFEAQDVFSETDAEMRPAYLISSMLDNCMQTGRNMHDGGAKYHDYGCTPIGMPNTADYLTAIKRAVFDEKFCTADELTEALKANFEGYEPLRKYLASIPKYGQENAEADSMMQRLSSDISKMFYEYKNRHGGGGKLVILTFVWAPDAGNMLGATAYGQFASVPVAQGVTPQSSAMTKGITAAMNSCGSIPFESFNGGASTMWDFDHAWASPELMTACIKTFFQNGGQIFQGNVTDVKILEKALENPDDYSNLIVRVGGYSARFNGLSDGLKKDIIERYRHNG